MLSTLSPPSAELSQRESLCLPLTLGEVAAKLTERAIDIALSPLFTDNTYIQDVGSPPCTNKTYIQNVGSPPIFHPYPLGDISKMYLHIGNNKTVRESEITAVFDADTATMSPITKKFLKIAQAKNKLHTVTLDVPKSIIVMADGTVYLAQVASSTIVGRVN